MEKIAIVGLSCLLPGSRTPQDYYDSLVANKSFLNDPQLPKIDAAHFSDIKVSDALKNFDEVFHHTLYVAYEALKDSGYLNTASHQDHKRQDQNYKANNQRTKNILQRTGIIMGARETCSAKLFDLFSPSYLSELESAIQELLAEPTFKFEKPAENSSFNTSLNSSQDSSSGSALNVFSFSYPTRVAAKLLNFGGASFAIDAACSSSLYSIKLAINYLLSGQADMMLAGGLLAGFNAEEHQHYFSVLGVSAQDNHSRAFCEQSKGIVTNDGGGVVVLKRLADAIEDEDKIYAVIDSLSWWSECGKERLMLAPSRKGQESCYQQAFDALASEKIEPKDIDYIECHATGTAVGDRIELDTLEAFYAKDEQVNINALNKAHEKRAANKNAPELKDSGDIKQQPLVETSSKVLSGNQSSQQPSQKATEKNIPLYGSVKGNIGHLLSGSGVASLIKVIYSMNNGVIPASYDVKEALQSKAGKFAGYNLVDKNTPWPESPAQNSNDKKVRRAALSCFGFGGSHSHLLLSEYKVEKYSAALAAGDLKSSAQDYKVKALNIVGLGVQLGNLSGPGAVSQALKKGRGPAPGYATGRLRGLSKSLATDQEQHKNYQDDYYFPDFDFDFLENGVKPSSGGEGLAKELLLLKVVNQALEDAGFVRGEGRNVAVLISAKQILFQVQLYLEHGLKKLINSALSAQQTQLQQEKIEALIKLAQESIVAANNSGFGFVATTIGPIAASRITSAWGFTGPTFKMDCLEYSFARSLELAEHLLQFENLEAVVVAAIDNDPALERCIWYRQHGHSIGFDLKSMSLSDGAVAMVLSRHEKVSLQAKKNYAQINATSFTPLSHISNAGLEVENNSIQPQEISVEDIALSLEQMKYQKIDYLEFSAAGGEQQFDKFKQQLGQFYKARSDASHQDENGQQDVSDATPLLGSAQFNFGYSFTCASALGVLKSTLMLHENFIPQTLSANPQPSNADYRQSRAASKFNNTAFAEPLKANVSAVTMAFDGVLSHVSLSAAAPIDEKKLVRFHAKKIKSQAAKRKNSLIRKVNNKFLSIRDVILQEENIKRFSSSE